MSFITKNALEYMLRDKKTFDEITELCSKNSKMCKSQKQLVCKKTLQVSGYKVPHGTDSCVIMKELLELAREIERPNKTNIIIADIGLINSVDMYGTKSLQEFFVQNGYRVNVRRSIVQSNVIYRQPSMSRTRIINFLKF